MPAETKECPFCSEEIKTTARKCKHCGEWLPQGRDAASIAAPVPLAPPSTLPCGSVERGHVLDLLSHLVDKNLVVYEEDEHGQGRYRLLETARQYARDRLLESGKAEPARARHRDHFLALAEEAKPKLQGPDQLHWLDRLETEHDNLRAALAWCEQTPEDVQAGLRLVGALGTFWDVRGHHAEGRALAANALTRAGAEQRTEARAKALYTEVLLAVGQSDFEAATRASEECLTIYQKVDGDRADYADLLMMLGFSARHRQGDAAAARVYFEQSLALRRKLGDVPGIAESLTHLGRLAQEQGDPETARRLMEEALRLVRSLNNKREIAFALRSLAELAAARGDWATAHPLLDEAISLHRELGDKRRQAECLWVLANEAIVQGDVERARAAYEEGVTLYHDPDDPFSRSHMAMTGGHILLEQGDYGAARARYEEGLALRRKVGDVHLMGLIGWALLELGHAAWCQRDYEAAQGHVAEAAALFQRQGDAGSLLATLESVAGVAAGQEQNERAACLFGAAQSLRQSLNAPVNVWWRRSRARLLAAARDVLEGDEYAQAREQSRAMSLEQAIEYALEDEAP